MKRVWTPLLSCVVLVVSACAGADAEDTMSAASGDGSSGDGTSGVGTSGDGTSGDGTSGDGTSGDGTSGDGTSGDGTGSGVAVVGAGDVGAAGAASAGAAAAAGGAAGTAGPPDVTGTNRGQITDEWRGYCVATFTQDYVEIDGFGDEKVSVLEGDEYLVLSLDEFFGIELAYLTSYGPDSFEVEADAATGELPFTSNCTEGQTIGYLAVFTDVTVYAEQTLETPLCELAAGQALESSSFGFAAVDFAFSGPAIYDVSLYPYSEQCGGATNGYISVPEVEVNGWGTWLVPLASILGPRAQ